MPIAYDNDRDRLVHGFDAGVIISGKVVQDEDTGRFVILDDDGSGFDPHVALQRLAGKEVRLTLISMESMEKLEEMLARTRGAPSDPGQSGRGS